MSATTLVVNDIVNGIDKTKHCAVIFVDLSKAFYTVDHSLLLLTLSSVGFTPGACAWFKSYLDGRHQCVKIGMNQSESILITKGVPQGSVLGQVLFTIYVNTIVPLLNCQVHLYADDTILYCIADSVKIAME